MTERFCANYDQIMSSFQTGPRDKVVEDINRCVLNELRGMSFTQMAQKQEQMFGEILGGVSKLKGNACSAERVDSKEYGFPNPHLEIGCGPDKPAGPEVPTS